MEVRSPNLQLFLLLMVFPATAGKYVKENRHLSWTDAQHYCKTIYTDLAPVSNDHDLGLIYNMTIESAWIGLMRIPTDRKKWQWSGGAEVSKSFWGSKEPNGETRGEEAGLMGRNLWYDSLPSNTRAFICYKVYAVRERMTWYEALQHCRKNHQDLASVASETEMMLIKTELSKELSSRNVWIGLTFLSGDWRWIDGQPFSFESWGADQKPICPDIDCTCGAIRVSGTLQKEDELVKVEGVNGWNALDCDHKRHFLCY